MRRRRFGARVPHVGSGNVVARSESTGAALDLREADAKRAGPYNSVALSRFLYGFDWEGADPFFGRALEINPNYVRALCRYGITVQSGALGRTAEAVATPEKAVALDPLAAYPLSILAWVLAAGGRNEDAERIAREGMKRDRASSLPVLMGTIALARIGRIDEAVELAEHGVLAFGRLPWAVANLALACSRAGDGQRAGLVCDELAARSAHDYVPAFPLATAYAAVERMDEAFAALELGCEERDPTTWSVRLHRAGLVPG